jgi:uncharacterized protein (DUF1684 family)
MILVAKRLVSVAAVAFGAACSADPPSYEEALARARAEKDLMLRDSTQSPVPPGKRASWPSLEYYPPDESYRVPASLASPAKAGEIVVMPTSTGQQRQMRRAGTLRFSLKGTPLQLSAFSDVESGTPNRLFVPFGDLTNGQETYPGGRYLDLDPTATGLYEIDFNHAYSPYCAYNPEYDCPFPPAENRLKIEVRAGEKYKDEAFSQ